MHAIRGHLAIVAGALSLLMESPHLTPDERQSVASALAAMDAAQGSIEALHALVRALAPEPLP